MKNEEKTLLILDIDETLIYATENKLEIEEDFIVFDYFVYKRPFLSKFLEEIQKDFLVAIWSSASDDFVQEIVKRIIPENLKLDFVWGRSRCTYQRNLQIDEYGYYDDNPSNHYHYIKPLKKVKRKGYNLKRILIIDDTPHKSKNNYGNVIYPKIYTGSQNDKELLLLIDYLKLIKDEKNVRRIEKRGWRTNIEN